MKSIKQSLQMLTHNTCYDSTSYSSFHSASSVPSTGSHSVMQNNLSLDLTVQLIMHQYLFRVSEILYQRVQESTIRRVMLKTHAASVLVNSKMSQTSNYQSWPSASMHFIKSVFWNGSKSRQTVQFVDSLSYLIEL